MSLSDFMTSRIINSSDLELRKEEVEILDEEFLDVFYDLSFVREKGG